MAMEGKVYSSGFLHLKEQKNISFYLYQNRFNPVYQPPNLTDMYIQRKNLKYALPDNSE